MKNAMLLIDVEPEYVKPYSATDDPPNCYFGSLYRKFIEAAEARGQHVIRIAHDTIIHHKNNVGTVCTAREYTPLTSNKIDSLDWIFCYAPVKPASVILMKRWFSAFEETDLDSYLRHNGFDAVTLLGQMASKRPDRIPMYCIDATAYDARQLGYRVTFIPDLIWTEQEEVDPYFLTNKFKGSVHIGAAQYLSGLKAAAITASSTSDTTDHQQAYTPQTPQSYDHT